MATSVNITDGLSRSEYEKLNEMTEEARSALIEEQLKDLTRSSDIAEIKEKLEKDFKKIQTEYDDVESELREELRSLGRDLTPAQKREMRSAIRAANDAWEEALAEEITTALDDHAELFVDLTDGSPGVISDIDPNGKTYTYTLGVGNVIELRDPDLKLSPPNMQYDENTNTLTLFKGTSQVIIKNAFTANPFGDDPAQTSNEPLMHAGKLVKNQQGQVITDVNSDGAYNQADIDMAEEAAGNNPTATAGNKFRIFFSTNPDEAKALPENVAKNFYWMESEESLFEQFNPENEGNLTDIEARKVIMGYNPIIAAAAGKTDVPNAVDLLYNDLANWHEGKNVLETWNTIFAGHENDIAYKRRLVNDLVSIMTPNMRPSDFEKIFGPANALLQSILRTGTNGLEIGLNDTTNGMTEETLANILILELHSGRGNTAILDKFAKKDAEGKYVEGELKDNAFNLAALNKYTSIIASSQFTPAAGISAAKDNEYVFSMEGKDINGNDVEGFTKAPPKDETLKVEFDRMFNQIKNAGYGGDDNEYDGDEWDAFMNSIHEHLFDPETGGLVADPWQVIANALDHDDVDAHNEDSVLLVFSQVIDAHASPRLKKALYDACGSDLIRGLTDEDYGGAADRVKTWGSAA